MTVYTSPDFASAAASGQNWREAARAVLEQLESVQTAGKTFNLGFLYVSDRLTGDLESIISLFKSVLGIENWIGAVAVGVCGTGEEFIDQPAIAAMIGVFHPDDFCVFPALNFDSTAAQSILKPWLEKHDPMLVIVHADPVAEQDPALTLRSFEQWCPGFTIGGLSSSRTDHFVLAGKPYQNGLCGAAFSQNIRVATTLSQGCTPIGPVRTITQGDEHVIRELDSRKVLEVFQDDLRSMAVKKIDQDPDMIVLDEQNEEQFKNVLRGEVCVAFPVSESDRSDYLVRNIIGFNEDESLVITQPVMNGERMLFVHRDEDSVAQDLSKSLLDLRTRVIRDTGQFAPKAALYVSCAARAFSSTGRVATSEVALIRDIIGDVPLAGFYAGGEISSGRLYGYTGVLTLFL